MACHGRAGKNGQVSPPEGRRWRRAVVGGLLVLGEGVLDAGTTTRSLIGSGRHWRRNGSLFVDASSPRAKVFKKLEGLNPGKWDVAYDRSQARSLGPSTPFGLLCPKQLVSVLPQVQV